MSEPPWKWTIHPSVQLPTWWCLKQRQALLANLFPNYKFVGEKMLVSLITNSSACYLCLGLFHTIFIQRGLFYFRQQWTTGIETWKNVLKKGNREQRQRSFGYANFEIHIRHTFGNFKKTTIYKCLEFSRGIRSIIKILKSLTYNYLNPQGWESLSK